MMNALFLGSEQLGVTAVIAALSLSASVILDFRIGDVIASAYYTQGSSTPLEEKQANLLFEAACLGLIQGLFVFLLSTILCVTFVSLFTSHDIRIWWILAFAAGNGAIGLTNLLVYLLRFSERYVAIGFTQLAVAVLNGLFFVILVPLYHSLPSYFTAYALGPLCAMICITAIFLKIYRNQLKLIHVSSVIGMKHLRSLVRMLINGNLFSYTNLLHRTGDSLVVAFFCSDAVTGMYKVMRSLINCLSLFYDTIGQVSTPYLLKILERKEKQLFRIFARNAFLLTSIALILLIGCQFLIFPPFIEYVVGESYRGIELPTMAMTSCLIVILGVQLWVWPIFLHNKAMGKLTQFNGLAATVHIATAIFLYTLYPDNLWPGAISFLVHYLILAIVYFKYYQSQVADSCTTL